jgi:hypothetical protein
VHDAGCYGVPSTLRGSTPFPHLADWAADGALFALQGLKWELDKEWEPVGERFVASIAATDPVSWQMSLLHPAVFAFLAKEPAQWTWQQLQEEVARDGDGIPVGSSNVHVWRSPGPQFDQLLRQLGRGSRGPSCAKASFLSSQSPQFQRYLRLTSDAIDLLGSVTPGFAADLRTTVHAIALVNDQASFRGSSGAIHRGLILLSPDESWDVCIFAEELVHESTHNVLDLLSLRKPLLDGPDAFEERYSAPFRPDPRHLFGNFHAITVVSRLLWLFSAFENLGIGKQTYWQQRRKDYAIRASRSLMDVQLYGSLSENARTLLNQLVVPTLTQFAR